MPSLDVDPELYSAASAWIGQDVADGLSRAYGDLMTGLGGTDAMAGSDSGGRAWSAQYDPAARQAVSTLATAQHAALALADLLELTGFNHGRAETMSNTGRRIVVNADVRRYSAASGVPWVPCLVPSAAGGTGDLPTGWSFVRDAVGLVWPDGSPDRLRAAASSWRSVAGAIVPLLAAVDSAVSSIEMQRSPEVRDAAATCTGLRVRLADAADACGEVAAECEAHACRIDVLHDAVKEVLVELAVSSAVTQGVGLLGAIVTVGISEGMAQTAEAGEVAACAARVATLIASFVARVVEAAPSLLRAEHAAKEVEVALVPLKDATAVTAELTEVEAAEAAATTVERAGLAAEQRFAKAAAEESRASMPAVSRWRSHKLLTRHFEDHGADFSATSPKDYAAKSVEFYKRGVSGRYEMKIDDVGDVRIYDRATNTFGSYRPDGTVKTFYKPSSPTYWDRQPGMPA